MTDDVIAEHRDYLVCPVCGGPVDLDQAEDSGGHAECIDTG